MIKNVRTISLKKNVFVKLFETLFGSDIFSSYNGFQCQDTDEFGSVVV